MITGHPDDRTGYVGEDALFTVCTEGSVQSYQWQYAGAAGTKWYTATAQGNKTATLTVPITLSRSGNRYRCAVTGSDGKVVYSQPATLTAVAAPVVLEITSQPKSVTTTADALAEFTVIASGEGLTYQWQYKTKNASDSAAWTNNSCKSDTLRFDPAESWRNGYRYRCVITDANGNSVTSDVVTLTVNAAAVSAPVITTQPKAVTAAVGSTAKFTVAATGEDLSYQWQFKAPNYGWQNNTCTSAAFSVPATAGRDGYQYRCVIKNAGGSVTSNAVTLTVKAAVAAPVITAQPKAVTAAVGSTAKFTVAATGENLKYQWQFKAPGYGWQNNTCTSAAFSVPATAGRDGYQYRCIIKNAGGSVTSNAVTLTVKAGSSLKIAANPKNVTTTPEGKASFTVKATGEGLSYQWQYKAPGYGWTKNSCTTATFTVSAPGLWRDGYQYRCIVTDASGNTATSGAATLTVEEETAAPEILSQPEDVTTTADGKAVFTVEADGNDLSYQWQFKAPGYDWKSNTCTSATFTISAPGAWRDGYQYRCIVTDAEGNELISDAATLTVE